MTHEEKRLFLIRSLLAEKPDFRATEVPKRLPDAEELEEDVRLALVVRVEEGRQVD